MAFGNHAICMSARAELGWLWLLNALDSWTSMDSLMQYSNSQRNGALLSRILPWDASMDYKSHEDMLDVLFTVSARVCVRDWLIVWLLPCEVGWRWTDKDLDYDVLDVPGFARWWSVKVCVLGVLHASNTFVRGAGSILRLYFGRGGRGRLGGGPGQVGSCGGRWAGILICGGWRYKDLEMLLFMRVEADDTWSRVEVDELSVMEVRV